MWPKREFSLSSYPSGHKTALSYKAVVHIGVLNNVAGGVCGCAERRMTYNVDIDERELVGLVRKADAAAMKAIYCNYAGRLAAVCSRYVSVDDDVKDILHDVFVKAFTSISKFEYRGKGSLGAWLSRIAVNESLSFLKRNGRFDKWIDDGRMPDVAEDEAPDMNDVPTAVIYDMIRRLPEGYRTVFNLNVIENRSHAEIAGMLGITESTSASQLHRAKRMLASWIAEYRKKNNPD